MRLPAVIACILLLSVPAAAWSQLAGGPTRVSLLDAPPQLDVVGVVPPLAEGDILLDGGPGAVDLGDALWAVVTGGGCKLWSLPFGTEPMEPIVSPAPGCDDMRPRLVGYDAVQDHFLLCNAPSEDPPAGTAAAPSSPVVVAIDRRGERVWDVSAADLRDPDDAQGALAWGCTGALVDQPSGLLVVPATAHAQGLAAGLAADHRVLAVRLGDGGIEWQTRLALNQSLEALTGQPLPVPLPVQQQTQDVRLQAVVAADEGYFVTGSTTQTGILWAVGPDQEGHVHPVQILPQEQDVPTLQERIASPGLHVDVSAWPGVEGGVAVLAMGENLVRIDARSGTRAQVHLTNPIAPHPDRGALWWIDVAVVPGTDRLVAVDMNDPVSLRWDRNLDGAVVEDMALQAPDRLYVLTSGDDARFLEVNLHGGATAHWLPLPAGSAYRRIVPSPEGILLLAGDGSALRLGEATATPPTIHVADRYPRLGERIEVRVTGANHTLHWGDGATATGRDGDIHAYAFDAPDPHVLRATAVADDGTTSTSLVVMEVGQTPPPVLTRLQRWFSADNQDMTWGVLGLILGTLGALFTFGVRSSRRYRLGRDLLKLQRLRVMSEEDPLGALARLRAYRADARQRAQRGRIDEAHYSSLVAEANTLAQSLQQRTLRLFRDRMTPPTWSLVETALADGILTRDEMRAIKAGVAHESLEDRERRALLDMLGDWHGA